MPQALITINAVAGSDDDLPLNTLVQLDNTNVGGEVSYLWSILDQPAGPADSLSSTTVQNPTFTPQKEGSYLLRLVVNQSLSSEQVNQVVAAVRHLKGRYRIPAAGETVENDAADGWAQPNGVNSILEAAIETKADPGSVIAVCGDALQTLGDVVRPVGISGIKTGLPGAEVLPVLGIINALNTDVTDNPLMLAAGAVDGGAMTLGKLCFYRVFGFIEGIAISAVVNGDIVYVSDTGTLSRTPGTTTRSLGRAINVPSAGVGDVWFNGLGGG